MSKTTMDYPYETLDVRYGMTEKEGNEYTEIFERFKNEIQASYKNGGDGPKITEMVDQIAALEVTERVKLLLSLVLGRLLGKLMSDPILGLLGGLLSSEKREE